MASLRTLLPLAAAVVSVVADGPVCSGDTPLSCGNSTAVEDTCCFITAGHLVLTQFWDTDPVTGPEGEHLPPTEPPNIYPQMVANTYSPKIHGQSTVYGRIGVMDPILLLVTAAASTATSAIS
jgi:hypothetical protein